MQVCRCAIRANYAKVTPMRRRTSSQETLALAALFIGACAIGSSGTLVRLSETGPTATGFWRGALALPFLAIWAWAEERRGVSVRRGLAWDARIFWAGAPPARFCLAPRCIWYRIRRRGARIARLASIPSIII